MNRSDVRLVIAIISTAVITAGATAVLVRPASPPPPPPPPDLAPVWDQLAKQEARLGALEHPSPINVIPVELVSNESETCDEVSCVLNNYEPACCARFKLSEALDRAQISEGVHKLVPQIEACGVRSSAKGKVKLHVQVTPDGSVKTVTVSETPDPKLGACVASKMMRATFEKTRNGGSFSYPFVF